MKTTLLLSLLSLVGLSAGAQTNTLLFQNDNNSLITNALSGSPVRSNDYIRAQLYYAPDGVLDEAAFVPVGNWALVGAPPGRYIGGNRLVPVPAAGTPVMIQVRAYEFFYGNSYEEAEAAPAMNGRRALVGKSRIARAIPGGGPTNSSSRLVGPFTVTVAGGGAYLGVNDLVVAEGSNGVVNATFRISLISPQTEPVSVDFATLDGTALAGHDYVATNGTLTFEPGELSKPLDILLTADESPEPDETFYLNLSNPTNGFVVRAQGSCLITEVRIASLSIDTTVSFNTVLGRRYMVEKTTDMVTWQGVSGATNVLGTGLIVTAVDRGSGCTSVMVYRARLLDP